jgi:hypothetical protein
MIHLDDKVHLLQLTSLNSLNIELLKSQNNQTIIYIHIFVLVKLNEMYFRNFHTSVQHPVACAIEVTINTAYATLFVYYPLLEDVLFIATCFGSVGPSSGSIHTILRTLLYLQRIRWFCIYLLALIYDI